jgi:Domain of unknown function (DUF4388)
MLQRDRSALRPGRQQQGPPHMAQTRRAVAFRTAPIGVASGAPSARTIITAGMFRRTGPLSPEAGMLARTRRGAHGRRAAAAIRTITALCYDAATHAATRAGQDDAITCVFEITMSSPVLSGDLRSVPLPDILLLLNNNGKTGSLLCSRGGVTKTLEWEKGDVVFARSTAPGDRLGAFLLARSLVTPEQLQQADPMVGSQERLGKALVRLGLLTPSVLWDSVRGQVTEIIYSLFHWQDGFFEFREGTPPREKIALNISLMNLIMEGTRRLDEWSRVREKIQSDQVVLAPVKTLEEAVHGVTLSDFEKTVLGLVDARRTVRDIVAVAGREEFETWQALHGLLSAGVIRVQLLAFDRSGPPAGSTGASPDDAALDATITRYAEAVSEIMARASTRAGAGEVGRLRRKLRDATFERAELLREVAVESDGRIDRRILLANVVDYPPEERAAVLRAALDRLVQTLAQELKGTVTVEDVLTELRKGRGGAAG